MAPHANAALDLIIAFHADVIVTADNHSEIWHSNHTIFEYKKKSILHANPLLQLLKIGLSLYLE